MDTGRHTLSKDDMLANVQKWVQMLFYKVRLCYTKHFVDFSLRKYAWFSVGELHRLHLQYLFFHVRRKEHSFQMVIAPGNNNIT